ncbi:hypothetical protein AGDE_12731 [Angomonas deanei]|nr:hypothetical protein AGDE_12731 [Angomonas deanei]|eukprot:EPY23787.1 hypothetical protein AGDE_12731 [Angomonas deanei]
MDGSFQLFVLSLDTDTSFPMELTLIRQVLMGPQCQVFGIAAGSTTDGEVRFFALVSDGTHRPNENGPIVLRGKDGKVLAVENVSVDTPSPSPMLANIVKNTCPPSSHGSFLCMGVQPSDPSKTTVQSVGVSPSLQQVLEKCAVEDVQLSCDAFPAANGVYVALFAKSFIALVEVSPLKEASVFVYEPESDVTHIVGSSPVLVTDQRNTVCVLHGTRGADESTSGAVVNLKVLLLHNMKKMHTTTRQNGPLSPGVSEDTIRRIVREEVEKSNKGVNAKLDEIHGMLSRLLSLQGA